MTGFQATALIQSGTAPYVVVLLLNWNGKTDTLECLASFNKIHYENYSVVVIDNGSSDDSVAAIKAAFPEYVLIETGANYGYAGGNNYGLRWALEHAADYVLLLNNDTVVDPDLLSQLVAAAQSKADAGVFGAKIFFYDQPDTLCYGGSRWDPARGCPTTLGWGEKDGVKYSEMSEVAYANGCAIFAPAQIFREIGVLDANMFLIYEETDFCYRARKAGYKSWFVPDAKVWHKISAAIGGSDAPLARYFNARNQLIWGTRHLDLADRMRLYRHIFRRLRQSFVPHFVLANAPRSWPRKLLWSASSWLRQFSRGLTAPGNKAELLGLFDFYRRRFGDCPDRVREWNAEAKRLRALAKQDSQ